MPHYDALVITLCINGFDVHRVSMDPGQRARSTATSSFHIDETFSWHAKFSKANPL